MIEHSDSGTGHDFDIAIIGLAARFPKSGSAEEFWKNLCAGTECISFFAEEELARAGASAEFLSGAGIVRAAALLDDIDLFDAEFFGYSPGEARTIDPQQRLFLESAWEALEDAGYAPSNFAGPIGVYAGTSFNSYLMRLLTSGSPLASADGMQLTLGNDKDYLTTRVSYKLNLRGPSVCVQTACSTSLAAVHMACQALIEHECDMALAGGVTIRCPQPMFYRYHQGGILSPDGHCRTFDAGAEGTIFGNGLGVVVLKRYEEAVRDGDHIYALIRGSAMNNDGSSKVGYTAPSVEGQAQVITRAMAAAGVDPGSISYIEAHGTATRLGDAIEISALKQAIGIEKNPGSCALGTVKTNIGHLDTAAGIAGLIKTALALKNGIIPPSLNFDSPNPELQLQNSAFRVQTEATPWPRDKRPSRAGVSSFGIGGTNVHVVLEEAPERLSQSSRRAWHLLPLSARTETALDRMSERLVAHLKSHPESSLEDIAYTMQVGRESFPCRRTAVARSVQEMISTLERDRGKSVQSCDPSKKPSVIFMFPGQGDQHVNMAKELYDSEPAFRDCVDECARLLRSHLGRDIRELLYCASGHERAAAEELAQTRWTQPALFVVEYALARLWMNWGVQPAAMIGHSLGELVAACLAGIFSLEDALALVAQRGKLIQETSHGSMLAVSLAEAEIDSLPPSVSVAAVNAPRLCVLSGPSGDIQDLQSRFEKRKIACRILRTSHAYHSMTTEPAMAPFHDFVERVKRSAPAVPCISCVTGDWLSDGQATSPGYWAEQIRKTVRFGDGLTAVSLLPNAVLLEVGPRRSLCKIAQQYRSLSLSGVPLASLGEVEEGGRDGEILFSSLGALWSRGVDVNWRSFNSAGQRLRVSLPTYPFERRRYWYDESNTITARENTPPVSSESGARRSTYFRPAWKLSAPARLAPHAQIPRTLNRPWLVFGDTFGLSAALSEIPEAEKQSVLRVSHGERFEQQDQGVFTLRPASREDYSRLFETLRNDGVFPHTIVHCGTASEKHQSSIAEIDARLHNGFESLMLMTSEAGKFSDLPFRLFVICDQLHSISGDEIIDPAGSAVLGICRVAPMEIPDLVCRCIDVVLPKDFSRRPGMAKLLVDEMCHESSSAVVAYRGENRWELFFDPLNAPEDPSQGPVIRERGVYLITGGLGGVGAEIALSLARNHKARLALIGRTPLPPRTSWSQWLREHGKDDPISARIEKALAMEKAGGEVLALNADVSSREQMEAAVENVRNVFGNIHGVLHLAAVPGGGLIQTRTIAEAWKVFAPKIQGTLLLEEILRGQPLDFFVLFSSTFAITGAVGQTDYCAANAFLGAFANSRQRAGGTPVIAIDWDGWKVDSWQHKIRHLMPEFYQELRKTRERVGIGMEEGFEMLKRAIQMALPQIIISKQDFSAPAVSGLRRGSRAESGRRRPGANENGADRGNDPAAAPRTDTEEIIVGIWQDILGVSEIGINDNFFHLGGHSLFAIQIAAQVREKFHIELEMRKLLENPTVATLAELVDSVRAQDESDSREIMDMLNEIAGLSPDEVRERLDAASNASASAN